MSISDTLKQFRSKNGISQETAADATFSSQKYISEIERGLRHPEPSFNRYLLEALPAAVSYYAQAVYDERQEFVSVPYLNAVDHHLQTSLDVIINEYAEGIDSARRLKMLCRNKLNKQSLLSDERIELMALLGQIVDTYTANKVLLVSMAETYGIDIEELEARHIKKLEDRGYWRPLK